MEYIRKTTDIQIQEPTVVSLGKFDGFHLGHKLLLSQMLKKAREGLTPVMFTFDVPPKAIVSQEISGVLTTNEEKASVFAESGIRYLIEYPFTDAVRAMEPEDFLRMLVEKLHVKCVVAGKDFCFGHNRSGTYRTLLELGPKYGFEAIILDKKEYEHREISSTFIREEILAGHMERANLLLGYEYFVRGTVVHGRALGRTIGIPTINLLPPPEKLLPPFGVYVTQVRVIGETDLGCDTCHRQREEGERQCEGATCLCGITNIGKKPTIEGVNPVGVETHIFNYQKELYDREVEIRFLNFLRKEQKFASVEALTEQVKKDMEAAKAYLAGYKRRRL